jgi:hypothetical protein
MGLYPSKGSKKEAKSQSVKAIEVAQSKGCAEQRIGAYNRRIHFKKICRLGLEILSNYCYKVGQPIYQKI